MAESYELVHVSRSGHEQVHPYSSEEPLEPGSIVHFEGRDWLVDGVDGTRVTLKPARYRLKLRHPDGREELGALRRYRADAHRASATRSAPSRTARPQAGRSPTSGSPTTSWASRISS